METTRENKDQIDFRVLRGLFGGGGRSCDPNSPNFMVIGPFLPCPTTNYKQQKYTWPQNCCWQRYPMRVATLEIWLSWYYKGTIKGRVIKGLQNLFPSALSFNHKTVLPTWKIVNEDWLIYELTTKGILGIFPSVFL